MMMMMNNQLTAETKRGSEREGGGEGGGARVSALVHLPSPSPSPGSRGMHAQHPLPSSIVGLKDKRL